MHLNGKSKQKEINFWVMPNAGFATRPILNNMIEDYQQQHPNVKINLSIHPWSLAWSRLMDVIKGKYLGPKPDILQLGSTWVATLAYLGALEKIPDGKVLPGDAEKSAYIWDPGAQGETDSDLFCVPWFIDVRVLYYRRDLFEKIGLSPARLQDWKGFYAACQEIQKFLKKGGPIPQIIAPLGIPGQNPGVLMHDLAPWIWGAGGDFFTRDLSKACLNEDAALKGCEFYFDLINNAFMPVHNNALPQGNFFSGRYAMQFSGSWPVDSYLNPNSDLASKEVADGFDVALFPAGPQGRYSFLGGSNLGVTSYSTYKNEAWNFVRFMIDPDRQSSHARAIGALPARMASLESLFEKHPNAKKVFWDSIGLARRLPRLIELGSIEQLLYRMGMTMLGQVRSKDFSNRKLYQAILAVNQEMNSVLSIHRYEGQALEQAQ